MSAAGACRVPSHAVQRFWRCVATLPENTALTLDEHPAVVTVFED